MPDASFTLVMWFKYTSQTEWKQLRGTEIEEIFQVETENREKGDKVDGTKTSNINTHALPKKYARQLTKRFQGGPFPVTFQFKQV